jgi:hypothetical protein
MSWKNREIDLFDHLKNNYIEDLSWSEDDYSHHDCYSINLKCDIELKCRNKHYDDLVIEKYKYEKLMSRADKHNTIPVYLCQTPKGIYGFNLSLLPEPEWFIKGMPKTSHFSQRQFIDKEVGMIHISHAKLYK